MYKIPAAIFLFLLMAACDRSIPADVAATVNGRPITNAELDKQYQLSQLSSASDGPSGDQQAVQKLEVLRTLIDNEIILQRAEKLGLMAADSEVDAKFNELKAPYAEEDFAKQLADRKMTTEELRRQLRRDLSVQNLFSKEITSKITVTDKDISNFYTANKASFNLAEPQFRMAQILVTPFADSNVRNLKNDNALSEDQARKKIEGILLRLRKGEDFAALAENYSEDPNSTQNGGDLGFIPESALDRANPDLRKALLTLRPGELTPVLHTNEGYRVLKLITREPAGQRDLADPKVQQQVRETLTNRKDQLLRAAYYEMVRNDAKVVNAYVQKIVTERIGK